MVFRVDETLWLVPVVHGSGSYARALVHWLLEHPADALAVPLPEAFPLRGALVGAACCATGSAPTSDTESLRPLPRTTIPLLTSSAFTSS